MILAIHRGTREIGGTCVELCSGKTRIIIDFGMPLVDEKREPFDASILRNKSIAQLKESKILPNIKGLYRDEPKGIDALLISHSHQDHYGLLDYANPDIPLYMSQGVKAMIEVSNIFIPKRENRGLKPAVDNGCRDSAPCQRNMEEPTGFNPRSFIHNKPGKINANIVKPWKSFKIGNFTITPYLVDHSGPDALAFLVEADGKRVYYSGDFRAHGRKSILFKKMLENPPKDIDYLLLEGSMLGRDGQRYKDESSVEQRMKEILRETKNIVFLSCSSQNIDRIVSAYRACLKTGRTFVVDLYTAFILTKLKKISEAIPQYDRDNMRVIYWRTYADILANAGYRDILYVYKKRKIELFEVDKKKDKMLMLVRDNSIFPKVLKGLDNVNGAKLIYSMYEKYLAEEFKAKCDRKGIDIEHVHTSGHATVDDLKTFASALNPKITIPIHTFSADKYKELFKNVKVLDDGQVIDL